MRHLFIKFSLSLLCITTFAHADDQSAQPNDSAVALNNAINILVGAYNGAVQAMGENETHHAPLPIEKHEVQTLKKAIAEGQQQWQQLVARNGKVNLYQLGVLLNDIQKKHGKVNYDFERALSALNGVGFDNISAGLLDQHIIDELASSAHNTQLQQELKQTLPYAATILNLAEQMRRHPDQVNSDTRNGILESQAQAVIAKLKILYADNKIGISDENAQQHAKQSLDSLYNVLEQTHANISPKTHTQLLKVLQALGSNFTDSYRQWSSLDIQAAQKGSQIPTNMNAQTRELLKALKFDNLPEATKKKLLNALQH